MIKLLLSFLTMLFLAGYGHAQKQLIKITSGQTSYLQYYKLEPGKDSSISRIVTVILEYSSDKDSGNKDQPIHFAITSKGAAAGSSPSIKMKDYIISKDSFKIAPKKKEFAVPVTIRGVSAFIPEFFIVALTDASGKMISETDPVLAVVIQEGPAQEKTFSTPQNFSFINAANFDFEGNKGTSYVGNINFFDPDGFAHYPDKKRITKDNEEKIRHGLKMGYNLGVMKINFSKTDSLNSSYNYFENVLVRPLDSIKVGVKFLRQYNKLSNVSKNQTWSFYFQPMVAVHYDDRLKILIHLHTELFIDKWTTTTTITNYQQDTSVLNASNYPLLKDSIGLLNRFSKSTADIVSSTATTSALNFNVGLGITLEKNWGTGSLFIQPSFGWALNYARPTSVDKNLKYYEEEKRNIFAHLTRFRLCQYITTNVKAVIGIDVRGKFGLDPTYAAFIGVNIGYEGIKKLLE